VICNEPYISYLLLVDAVFADVVVVDDDDDEVVSLMTDDDCVEFFICLS
jgi:hypothetical protein